MLRVVHTAGSAPRIVHKVATSFCVDARRRVLLPRRHLVLLGSALALLPLPWSATNSCAHPTNEGEKDLNKENAKTMNAIEILPGRSIGELHLGARTKDLPHRAVVNGPAGSLDGIHFFAPDGVIEDIWIEDLRKFPREVGFAGKPVPRNASLDEIKQAFGPCQKVSGVKGGVFFNCDTGVTLGCDFAETGKFVQIRLKRR